MSFKNRGLVPVVLSLLLISCESKEVPDWAGAVSLRPILSAQAVFRAEDRDGNGKRDFWRADIAGLATLLRDGRPIALIELSQATADDRPVTNLGMLGGRKPKAGYWFRSIRFKDESIPDLSRFAVCAFPDSPRVSTWTFVVDQSGVIYRKQLGTGGGVEVYPNHPELEGWERVD